MRNYNTNYTAGELVMYIPESALSQMYQTYTLDGGEVFIMHGGKILSHSNKSLIGSEIFLGGKFFDGENTEIGKHYLMSRRAVDANSIIEGLEIVTITPKNGFFDNMLKNAQSVSHNSAFCGDSFQYSVFGYRVQKNCCRRLKFL
ncbi:MAG: hypothetical protein L6V93_17140 [Clostridiales bacterium]|nr:MAG: hypothetical protein L6V93_17140 [Clostridiales bacterium]